MDEAIVQELVIWSGLKHPNIVLFLGACLDGTSILIVSEFMNYGSLNDVFAKYSARLTLELKIKIVQQIVSAMSDLHSRSPPILHRDLKTANILVS